MTIDDMLPGQDHAGGGKVRESVRPDRFIVVQRVL
jgi:hypothetical protein